MPDVTWSGLLQTIWYLALSLPAQAVKCCSLCYLLAAPSNPGSFAILLAMRRAECALMGRNAVSGLAVLLCTLVIGAMLLHEKCRLGNEHWEVCGWMGIPHAGGPFPQP